MDIIFDSSTLILLSKIEIIGKVVKHIHILIPEAVKDESTRKNWLDARHIVSLLNENSITVERVKGKKILNKLRDDFKLHAVEAEAITLAIERGIPIAVDDLQAIKACKVLNHPFTTAIHLLITLHDNGIINNEIAFAKLEKLSYYGRYKQKIIEHARDKLERGV